MSITVDYRNKPDICICGCCFLCAVEANTSQEGALDQLMVTDTSDQEALDDFLNSSANGAGSVSSSLTSGKPHLT